VPKNVKIKGIVLVVGWEDGFKCDCGNTSHCEGFHPCTILGDNVEPTPDEWPAPLYKCDRCGVIYMDVNEIT